MFWNILRHFEAYWFICHRMARVNSCNLILKLKFFDRKKIQSVCDFNLQAFMAENDAASPQTTISCHTKCRSEYAFSKIISNDYFVHTFIQSVATGWAEQFPSTISFSSSWQWNYQFNQNMSEYNLNKNQGNRLCCAYEKECKTRIFFIVLFFFLSLSHCCWFVVPFLCFWRHSIACTANKFSN